jgi:hypothetical protein
MPWRNGDWPGCMVRFWDGSTGHPIANCDLASKTESQAIANARLIAAAPELYEAAEALLKDANARADLFNARCRDLRAALAKARGEA